MRLQILVMTAEKSVTVRFEDLEGVIAARALHPGARDFLDSLKDFALDVLDGNADAGIVEITPQNAVEVLGTKEPLEPSAPPAPETPPANPTPPTVHDASSTVPPEDPAPAAAPAEEPAAPGPASTVHDASSTIPPEGAAQE